MRKLSLLILLSLVISGCAGLGLNKKATLMPDEIWTQYETVPTGADREWEAAKVVGGLKWKLQ